MSGAPGGWLVAAWGESRPLGERPAVHYGTMTLKELEGMVADEARRLGWDCVCLQTNHEGCFVEFPA